MREIKRALEREATTPHGAKHDKEKAKDHMLEITRVLVTLSSLSSSALDSVQTVDPLIAATTSAFESGMSPVSLGRSRIHYPLPDVAARGRLVRREFAFYQLPSLIEAIFSSSNGGEITHTLSGDDAQTFVDAIYQVRSTFLGYREPVTWDKR